jgi:hypothetical protein
MREIFDIKHTQAVIPKWLKKGNNGRSRIRTVRKLTPRHRD